MPHEMAVVMVNIHQIKKIQHFNNNSKILTV